MSTTFSIACLQNGNQNIQHTKVHKTRNNTIHHLSVESSGEASRHWCKHRGNQCVHSLYPKTQHRSDDHETRWDHRNPPDKNPVQQFPHRTCSLLSRLARTATRIQIVEAEVLALFGGCEPFHHPPLCGPILILLLTCLAEIFSC